MKKLRMSRRVPVRLLVNIKSGALMVEGVVREISEGGMLFFCRSEFEVNTEEIFNLKVFDNEPDIALRGKLLYRRLEKEGDPTQGFLYGVEFADADSAVKESISRVVRFVTVRERYSKSAASVIKEPVTDDGDKDKK